MNNKKDCDRADDLLPNPHPGLLLKEDFLAELEITPYRLARATGLTPSQVGELLKGKRNITPVTALLWCRYFGSTPEFWLNLQARYEMIEAQRAIEDRLSKAQPYEPVRA